jgi:hypothetical protein
MATLLLNGWNKMKNKIVRKITLHKFYDITCYDNKTGEKVEFSEDFIPHYDSGRHKKFYYEYNTHEGFAHDDINLSTCFDIINKLYLDNKDKFDKISIIVDTDEDGYISYPRLVGCRKETDKEFNARIKLIKQKQLKKQSEKTQTLMRKRKAKEDKERKLLEKLKQKYGD